MANNRLLTNKLIRWFATSTRFDVSPTRVDYLEGQARATMGGGAKRSQKAAALVVVQYNPLYVSLDKNPGSTILKFK